MESRIFMSINFIDDIGSICSYDSIIELEKLVKVNPDYDFSKVSTPLDWYQYDEKTNLFDILATKVPDMSLRQIILQKLQVLYHSRVDAQKSNDEATEKLLAKFDTDYYYSMISHSKVKEHLESCQIISSKEHYQQTHENFLSIAPSSNEDYALRCKSIFENIDFSKNFTRSLATLGKGSGIEGFSIPITKSLSVINRISSDTRNIKEIMHWVTENCGFQCSVQGKKKSHLSATVNLSNGSKVRINCEFHIKISENNKRDGKNYYTRIYFGLMPLGQSKVVHLLHCGEHL